MRKIRELLWKLKQKLSKKNGIYYINGPELLPAPYTPEREAEVIAALEAGDPDARTALIEHNLRLVVYIAKKFECTGTGIEDLISIGTIGLCKAVGTFRSDKNIKLATYASRCIENEILMHLRKQSGKGGEVSLDEPLKVDFDGNELLLSDILGSEEEGIVYEIEHREEREAIRRAVASLDERERLIIELRYGLGGREEMTQKEVATYLGISQSYISRLEKKIITELRDRMTNV